MAAGHHNLDLDRMKAKRTSYPMHDIDPKHKDKKWILQFVKAFYFDYFNRKGSLFYNNRSDYNTSLKYAMGQQDIEQYKLMVGCDDTQQSFVAANWDILPIVPKFVEVTVGNMQKHEFNVDCQVIDPSARDEAKQKRYQLEAQIHLKETLHKIEQIVPAKFTDQESQDQPQSLDEIDLYMQLKYKHKMAISMEEGLDLILYLNDWEQMSEQIDRDLIIFGSAAIKDYLDSNGLPRARRVDPRQLLTSFSKSAYFKGCESFGELVTMTIAEFQRKCNTKFSATEKEKIADLFSNKNTNPAMYDTHGASGAISNDSGLSGDYRFGTPYDDVVITVLDVEFMSTNSSTYERKSTRHGNSFTYKKPYGYKAPKQSKHKREVVQPKYKVWYKALWIVGTDHIFNEGLVNDMKVPKSSFEEALSSYHVIAPGQVDMNNVAMVEVMRPIADDVQLNVVKLRQTIARARQKGLLIEIGGLENIPKGKGGEVFEPLELVAMYDQTGNLLYRRLDDAGNIQAPPMQELENGMARDVMNYIAIINFYFSLLRDATGINEIADASTPHPDMLKGVAEMAIASTNNALKHLFNARKYLFESLIKSLTIRIQETVKTRKIEGYAKALGRTDERFMQVNQDVSLHEMGIKIVDLPDDRERMMFEQQLSTSLQLRQQSGTGGITIADYYAVKQYKNLKMAEQYLAIMIRRRAQEDAAKAQQAIENTTAAQQKSAMVTAQLKRDELVLATDQKIRFEEAKAELQDRLSENEHQRRLRETNVQGLIKSDHLNQTGDNEAGLMAMKLDGNVEPNQMTSFESPAPDQNSQ